MKTYLVAALALALALGTVPAMAKGGGGGGGGGHGSAANAGQSIGAGVAAGSSIHHGMTDTIGADHTPNAVNGPAVQPSLSSRCAAVLDAPRMHTKAQLDYCLEQHG